MHTSQQQPLSPQKNSYDATTSNNGYHRLEHIELDSEPQDSLQNGLKESNTQTPTDAINDFNAHAVFLDGDEGIQTLQAIHDTETHELRTRPKKVKFYCGVSITAIIVSVIGLVIWLINCKPNIDIICNGAGASGKLLTILSAIFALLSCFCTIYNWNRGSTTSRLFTQGKNKRDALQFDIKDKYIKNITFWVDYGLPTKVEKLSKKERDKYLHEGAVIMEEGTEFICRFSDLQEIGWSTVINHDAFDYYIILNYFDTKTQKIVTYKSDLAEDKYGNERVYEQLQNVMKGIDPMWLEKIQVSNHIKKKRWYKQYRHKRR